MRTAVLFLLLLGICFNIQAQNPLVDDLIEQLVSKTGAEDADFSSFVEDLNDYLQNPLNLNSAGFEDLEKLHLLNEIQIQNLQNYVANVGQMQTIYELQLIEGFMDKTIKSILPFVTVETIQTSEKLRLKQILDFGRHHVIAETKFVLQQQKGYLAVNDSILDEKPNSVYQGDRMKYLTRYRFNYKNRVFAGITAEKDAGEAFGKYGFDFYSGHLQINDLGVFKNISVGDYQVKFGQGLIAWSGFGLGKSTEVLNIRKKAQGIRRYTSTNENLFMRGVGTTLAFGSFELSGFFSYKNIDANQIMADTIDGELFEITSLQNTGYHRTISEISDKNTVNEMIYGSNITYKSKRFKLGANFIAYSYNAAFEKSVKPYKYFDFQGNSNVNLSLDYQFFYNKFSFFGETAVSQNGAMATLNGLLLSVVPQLSFSVVQRYYQQDFHAFYSSSFSESSKISNESGIYYGISFHPIRKFQISAYVDNYSFPWLKYGINAPSHGNDFLVQLDYHAGYNVDMYLRWKNETKMHNGASGESIIVPLIEQNKQYIRYHISYKLNKNITLRNRIEASVFESEDMEYGFMAYQDVNYNFDFPLSFYMRFAIFDASYNARIYAYENDLLYNFSIPAYFGKGTRLYFMIKYKVANFISIRLRYAHSYYADRNIISSGLNEISGNLASEIKFQLSFKF
ncbi:MAG: helix-hairpin-helix domain-containing protein [Bacteroidota bacterium]